MTAHYKKGDMFEVGNYGEYDLILGFSSLLGLGFSSRWESFQDRYLPLKDVDDPYQDLATPTEFASDRWIHFVTSKNGTSGMDDIELEETFQTAFKWAQDNGLKKVITNGVRDRELYRDSQQPRIDLMKDICSRPEYKELEITLISLDRSYIEGEERSRYRESILLPPDTKKKPQVPIIDDDNEPHYEEQLANSNIPFIKEFHYLSDPRPHQAKHIIAQMKKTLSALNDGSIPNNDDYTEKDLETFVQSLSLIQNSVENRRFQHRIGWAIIDPEKHILPLFTSVGRDSDWIRPQHPNEFKDEYMYQPTIFATAILSRVLIDHPSIMLRLGGIERLLSRGWTCCLRSPQFRLRRNTLTKSLIERLEILTTSGCGEVLRNYPDFSHLRMKEYFEELRIRISSDLSCGFIERGEGAEVAERYQSLLEKL